MTWEHIKADWMQTRGKIKSKWGKLTDDDLKMIEGKWDQLVAKLHERYGYKRDEAGSARSIVFSRASTGAPRTRRDRETTRSSLAVGTGRREYRRSYIPLPTFERAGLCEHALGGALITTPQVLNPPSNTPASPRLPVPVYEPVLSPRHRHPNPSTSAVRGKTSMA